MGCGCKDTKKLPPVVEITSEPCPVLYITTEVEGTLKSNPPIIGKYHNVLTVYQGSKARVMYDSNGIPTIITEDGGEAGVTKFNDLDGRPKYAGQVMTNSTNIPDLTTDISNLDEALYAETTTRAEGDDYLEDLITTNTSNLSGRITTAESDIDTIEEKIPAQASSSNQLADKDFVNSSVATNTANFKGTFNTIEELEAVANPTNNDYGFVISTSGGNTAYNRYKYNGTAWVFEYALNNSSFTANQWASINSGVTTADVTKLAGIEAGAEVNVNADWDATSGDAQILHKPTIPTVNDATLTVTQNGVTKGTFSANASQSSTIALDDTTYSAFTGTDGTTAGTAGLVPAPATTDAGKYLKADGTWDSVSGGIPTNATFWGASYDSTSNSIPETVALTLRNSNTAGVGQLKLKDINGYVYGELGINWGGGNEIFLVNRGNGNNTRVMVSDNIIIFAGGSGWSNHVTCGLSLSNARIHNVSDPAAAQDAATKNYVDNAVASVGAGTKQATSRGWDTTSPLTYVYGYNQSDDANGALFYTDKDLSDIPVYAGIGVKADGDLTIPYLLTTSVSDGRSSPASSTRLARYSDITSTATNGSTTAPTSATVGTVGQLYSYVSNGVGHLAICTAVDTSVTPNTYTWSEFLSTDTVIPTITMQTTDPGEGASLAADHYIGVYQ